MHKVIGTFICEGDVTKSEIEVAVRDDIVFITQKEGEDSLDEIVVFSRDYIPTMLDLLEKLK